MASRVQHQRRGEAVPGVAKQTNIAAEGRNRRALGDIGNVVTVRGPNGKLVEKPLPQVSRPVTRSFCAQLLANAQAAAAENNKKVGAANVNVAIDGDGVLPGKGGKGVAAAPKANQKKVAAKLKPVAVIDVGSESEEEVKQASRKKGGQGSSRKISQSLTSTLTARSKAACGLANKPKKEQIVDIDASDIDNELAVVEYVEDIYNFYKIAENESRIHDYMDSQPEINDKMRAILTDWLVEVHNKFELMPETLYLTINIVDRYLAKKTVPRRELQLVGISAMLMASKYEEIWAPEVNDFVCISDRAYTHEQVLVMEKRILGELEWNLTVPTPYVFLVRFIKAACIDPNLEHLVYYLAELGVMNYATTMYCPSMLAASAVYAARTTLSGVPFWNETLKQHTGYSEPELKNCAELLVGYQLSASDNKLKVIYRKYSNPQRGAVATESLLRPVW
ncbi:hypothetical protein LguiB_004122 [Lonicera macranthoides]